MTPHYIHAIRAWTIRLALACLFFLPIIWYRYSKSGHLDYGSFSQLFTSYGFALTFLWSLWLLFNLHKKWVQILSAGLLLLCLIDLFLVLNYSMRLSASQYFVLLGNFSNASEFFIGTWKSVAAFTVFYATVIYFIFKIPTYENQLFKHRFNFFKLANWLIFLMIITVYAVAALKDYRVNKNFRWALESALVLDISSPVGNISQAITAILIEVNNQSLSGKRSSYAIDAKIAGPQEIDNFVLVIGESSRPQNWGLFGFSKNTTPKLSARNDIYPFFKVITTAPSTNIAVPSIVSFYDIDEWDLTKSRPSLLKYVHSAGYHTHWISTQSVDFFANFTILLHKEAQSLQFFDRHFDDVLVDRLQEIINQQPGVKKFIVLHTMGSHFQYEKRYPPAFSIFDDDIEIRNSYNNSVLFTDAVLASAIETLEKNKNQKSVLMYVSDHGQNLLDDERQLLIHGAGTEYDLSVPLFFWFNESAGKHLTEKIGLLDTRKHEAIGISNVAHTVLDLLHISGNDFRPEKSLVNQRFATSPQKIMLDGQVVNWPTAVDNLQPSTATSH